MLPMTVVMVLFAEPIVRVVFQRGVFDAYSTLQTSTFLTFSALGLVFFGMGRILATAFHALKDTRTPVKVAIGCLCLTVALDVAFIFPFKLAGIALASALSSTVSVFSLYRRLRRRVGAFETGLGDFAKRALLAGCSEALVSWAVWMGLAGIPEWQRLLAAIVVGGAGYWAVAAALGLEQARKLGAIVSFRRT